MYEDDFTSEIQSTSSIGQKSASVIKTARSIATTNEIETEINEIQSQNFYSETFESDDDDDDDETSTRRSTSKRGSQRAYIFGRRDENTIMHSTIDEANENDDYTDTFEHLTSSLSIKISSYKSSPMPRVLSSMPDYSESFISESSATSSSSTSDEFTNNADKLRKLVRKIRKETEARKKGEKGAKDGLKGEKFSKELIRAFIKRAKSGSQGNCANNSDTKIEVKKEVVDNLRKMLHIEEPVEENYFDYGKIDNFGIDLVHEAFPSAKDENRDEALRELKRVNYFRTKCDWVKFKRINDEIVAKEDYFFDSIAMIGDIASGLPRATLPADQLWKRFMKPLHDANKKKQNSELKSNIKYVK